MLFIHITVYITIPCYYRNSRILFNIDWKDGFFFLAINISKEVKYRLAPCTTYPLSISEYLLMSWNEAKSIRFLYPIRLTVYSEPRAVIRNLSIYYWDLSLQYKYCTVVWKKKICRGWLWKSESLLYKPNCWQILIIETNWHRLLCI